MTKLQLVLLIVAFVYCVDSVPVDYNENAQRPDIVTIEKDFESDENDDGDDSKEENSEETLTLYKRDVDTASKQFPLSAVIDNIEASLVQSAASVTNIAKNFTTTAPNDEVSTTPIATQTTTISSIPSVLNRGVGKRAAVTESKESEEHSKEGSTNTTISVPSVLNHGVGKRGTVKDSKESGETEESTSPSNSTPHNHDVGKRGATEDSDESEEGSGSTSESPKSTTTRIFFPTTIHDHDLHKRHNTDGSGESTTTSIPTTVHHDANKREVTTKAATTVGITAATNTAQTSTEHPPTTLIDQITAHQGVPINDDQPAHVVVERITVFTADQQHLPIIPSFDLHHTGVPHGSIKEIVEAKNGSLTTPVTVLGETTTTDKTPTTTTTPKIHVDDLKKAEKDLKNKVAEIQADPVILSARV